MSEPDLVAMQAAADQASAHSREYARMIASFYLTLKEMGVPAALASRMTETFLQARLGWVVFEAGEEE